MDNIDESFRTAVRHRRKELGLTQATLGELVALDSTAIVRVENGERRVTLQLAYELADALGTSLESLSGRGTSDYESQYRDATARLEAIVGVLNR